MKDRDKALLKLIQSYENDPKNPRSGYDRDMDRWFPHKSAEGGEDTIGYGNKLTKDVFKPEDLERFYNEGISSEEAHNMSAQSLMKAKADALRIMANKGIDLDYLDEDTKDAMTRVAYQTGPSGLNKFKKMLGALKNQDYPKAQEELISSKMASLRPDRAESIKSQIKPKLGVLQPLEDQQQEEASFNVNDLIPQEFNLPKKDDKEKHLLLKGLLANVK